MSDDMDILQRWAMLKLGSSDADALVGMVAEMTAAARSAALEEAAKVAEARTADAEWGTWQAQEGLIIAHDIRKLKT